MAENTDVGEGIINVETMRSSVSRLERFATARVIFVNKMVGPTFNSDETKQEVGEVLGEDGENRDKLERAVDLYAKYRGQVDGHWRYFDGGEYVEAKGWGSLSDRASQVLFRSLTSQKPEGKVTTERTDVSIHLVCGKADFSKLETAAGLEEIEGEYGRHFGESDVGLGKFSIIAQGVFICEDRETKMEKGKQEDVKAHERQHVEQNIFNQAGCFSVVDLRKISRMADFAGGMRVAGDQSINHAADKVDLALKWIKVGQFDNMLGMEIMARIAEGTSEPISAAELLLYSPCSKFWLLVLKDYFSAGYMDLHEGQRREIFEATDTLHRKVVLSEQGKIQRGLDSMGAILKQGYSLEMAIGLLMPFPVCHWPAVERLVSKYGTKKRLGTPAASAA